MKKIIAMSLLVAGLIGSGHAGAQRGRNTYKSVHVFKNESGEDIKVNLDVYGLLCLGTKSKKFGPYQTVALELNCPVKRIKVVGTQHSPKDEHWYTMKEKEKTVLDLAKKSRAVNKGDRDMYTWTYTNEGKLQPSNHLAKELVRTGNLSVSREEEKEVAFYPYEGIQNH